MSFVALRFLAFFLVVFGVHWALPKERARKLWLLLASYAFYASWDWRFLGLILASTAVDYLVGAALGRGPSAPVRRALLWLSLGVNLGILGFYKYFDFFVASAAELSTAVGLPIAPERLNLILPVGISFYTFQTLSYTIDVYRGRLAPVKSVTDFALFVAFFPQLVAGPIVRASEFLPQLLERRSLWEVAFRSHLVLFLFGYVKKACVADNLAMVVDPVFADPTAFGPASVWLALCAWAIQIYCDFSGYSDMAIATAGLLGYRLPLNFAFPYLAGSVTTFWRRWHISLSSWFRDYLYIPLGGNRRSSGRTYFNLLTVFLLCGLWHGASWNFVLWGAVHGLFLIFERLRGGRDEAREGLLGQAYTLLVVLLAWVFFRAQTLEGALLTYRGLFVGPGDGASSPLASEWWLFVLAFAGVHVLMRARVVEGALARLPDLAFAILYGAAWALVFPFAAADYQPFIYFQF